MTDPVDQKYRDLAESDLDNNYLLDAGAGTGKTAVLVNRIVEIVREGKVRLNEIAAITYTEKAAGELKFRVRAALEKEVPVFQEALNELESASIGTIHSFAASLLRERPADAEVDPRFMVLDEFEARILQKEAWDEWLEREMRDPPPLFRDALTLGLDLKKLDDLVVKLIEHRDSIKKINPTGQYPNVKELKSSLGIILDKLDGLAGFCKKKSDSLIGNLESLRQFTSDLNIKMLPMEAALFTDNFSINPRGTKTNWVDEASRDEMRNTLALAAESIRVFRGQIVSVVADGLLAWLKGYADYYESRKVARGVLDFQDLLEKARDLLKYHPAARRDFQNRYQRILVDEFQDTDPLQVEIVFYMVGADNKSDKWEDRMPAPGKLFIVGDPKQSLYAFRRADLQMYGKVESAFEGHGKRAPLIQNFRTVKSIVDWINIKFSSLFGAPSDYGPAYAPIEAYRKDPVENIKTGVWKLPIPGLDYDTDKKSADEARELEAGAIAAFIADVIGKWKVYNKEWRPIESGDIALLFPTRTGIQHFEKAFRARGIPYVVPGGTAFYKTAEILALLDCLKAIDRPDDPVALAGALRSPFFGFSDEEIFLARHHGLELDYTRAIPNHTGAQLFMDAYYLLNLLHQKRNTGNMTALIEEFYLETLGPALFMLKPGGEQRLANLYKVVERARRFEKLGAATFSAFVEHLTEAEDLRGEEEAPIVEGNEDFVRLMTIHGAKGLEFPMVILANITLSKRARTEPVHNRNSGKLEFNLKGVHTAGWEDARAEWDKILDCEETRKLYVACTRARDYLVLPVPEKGRPSKSYMLPLIENIDAPGDVPVNVFDPANLAIEAPDEKPFRFQGTRKEGPKSDKKVEAFFKWKDERKQIIESLWRRKYFRSVTELTKQDKGLKPLVSGEGAAMRFGTFVHNLMNEIGFGDAPDIYKLAQSLAADEGFGEAEISEAESMAQRAMNSSVWKRAARAQRRATEYPLALSDPDGIVSGRPDLVFIEDDKLVIVDYKTDRISSREEAKEKLADSYRAQGEQYALALTKLTGLPVKETIFLFLNPDPALEIPI